MDEFDTDPFMYRSNLVPTLDFSRSQAQQSSPDWASSTVSQIPIDFLDLASGVYEQPDLVQKEFAFLTEPHFHSLPLPTKAALRFDSNPIDRFTQELFDDGGQSLIAQDAWPSPLLQQLSVSDNTCTGFDMSEISGGNLNYALTREPTPIDENVPLQCHFLGCLEKQVFPTQSALKRHKDKHIRPYICHHTSCSRKSFGDKGGLERHVREVHGFQVYHCPVLSCKRSKRGFHRKYNLLEHQKRLHKVKPSIFLRARSSAVDEHFEKERAQIGREDEVDEMTREMTKLTSAAIIQGDDIGEQSLRSKLLDLLVVRAEIDEDIVSLQRVLNIMSGASPEVNSSFID